MVCASKRSEFGRLGFSRQRIGNERGGVGFAFEVFDSFDDVFDLRWSFGSGAQGNRDRSTIGTKDDAMTSSFFDRHPARSRPRFLSGNKQGDGDDALKPASGTARSARRLIVSMHQAYSTVIFDTRQFSGRRRSDQRFQLLQGHRLAYSRPFVFFSFSQNCGRTQKRHDLSGERVG